MSQKRPALKQGTLNFLSKPSARKNPREICNAGSESAVMGKAEGSADLWHGHVTALTVAPEYRRLGLAAKLMNILEDISEKKRCYFVDLFVRVSNKVAVDMYNKLGYTVYRTVIEYYSGEVDEDAYDMRKALSRDTEKKSVIPLAHPVRPEELD